MTYRYAPPNDTTKIRCAGRRISKARLIIAFCVLVGLLVYGVNELVFPRSPLWESNLISSDIWNRRLNTSFTWETRAMRPTGSRIGTNCAMTKVQPDDLELLLNAANNSHNSSHVSEGQFRTLDWRGCFEFETLGRFEDVCGSAELRSHSIRQPISGPGYYLVTCNVADGTFIFIKQEVPTRST